MATIIFRLLVCGIFEFFGRWVYRNPARLFPKFLYSDRTSGIPAKTARLFGFLLMLFGYFALLTIVTERFSEGLIAAFVALGLGVIAAWFLRPTTPPDTRARAEKPTAGFLTTRAKWFVGIMLVVGTIIMVYAVILAYRR